MGTAQAWAQCTARNTAFLPGEHVSYDLMFNWKFIWIKVGTAELTTDTARYQGKDGYCFRLKSLTSKRADFFFKMRDTLTCYVTNRLEPLYFCKAAEEGKRHTKDEAWFSYRDGFAHVKQCRTWYSPADRAPQEMEYTAESGCIFDMLSILGQARSWRAEDYKVGDKIHFPMATGRRVEQQTLIYRGIENVEAKDGHTYRCLVFSFVEYDEQGKETWRPRTATRTVAWSSPLWSMMSKERRTRSSPSLFPTMTITCPSVWTCTSASVRPRPFSAE